MDGYASIAFNSRSLKLFKSRYLVLLAILPDFCVGLLYLFGLSLVDLFVNETFQIPDYFLRVWREISRQPGLLSLQNFTVIHAQQMLMRVKKVDKLGVLVVKALDKVIGVLHFMGDGSPQALHHEIQGVNILLDFLLLITRNLIADLKALMVGEPV